MESGDEEEVGGTVGGAGGPISIRPTDQQGGTWVIHVGLGWDLGVLGGTWVIFVGLGCLLWDLDDFFRTWVSFVGLG